MNEDMVASFVSMTGTDEEFAHSFLEASDWKLQSAIDLFLGGGSKKSKVEEFANMHGVDVETARAMLEAQGTSSHGADPKVSEFAKSHGVDEATAKVMMEAQGVSDDVRAPIAPTVSRLFNPNTSFVANNSNVSFRDFEKEARQLEAQRRLTAGKGGIGTSAPIYPSAFKKVEEEEDYQYDSDNDEVLEEDPPARDKNLQNLFSPPRELLFQGSFDDARATAKRDHKWILVNIQKDSEFFSYVLNRDLWQSDVISDVLSTSFVFFQHECTDTEAVRYINLYKVFAYPHIGIIDPRTAELVLVLDLKPKGSATDPNDLRSLFLDKVSHFLEVNPMSDSRKNLNLKSEKPSGIEPGLTPVGKQLHVAKNTHEKQEYEPLEAVSGEHGCIRIRLFDGKTVSRNFNGDSNVSQLFSYVHELVPETAGRAFDIFTSNPSTSLAGRKSETINDVKLLRTALMVRWI